MAGGMMFTDQDGLQRQLTAMVAQLLTDLTAGAPPQEMASWATKADAAQAILDGDADKDQAAMIGTEADIRGKEVTDYAVKIAAKSDQFTALVPTVVGLRGKFSDAIAVSQKPDDLDPIFLAIDAAFNGVRKAAGL